MRTIPDDAPVAVSRVDQFLGWLLGVPWWVVFGFALILTIWLMWVSWPRARHIEGLRAIAAKQFGVNDPELCAELASELLSLRRSPSLSGGEVVAWRVRERPGFDWRFVDGDPGRDPRLNGYEKQPLYASPAPDIIAAKDAEIERVTRERDAAQGWPERENITHYCTDCEMVSVLHEGRCGCGSGRVVSISSMWTQAEAAEEALKAVWPFVAKHYSPHIESEFKLAEQVNNALRSFASLNGSKP